MLMEKLQLLVYFAYIYFFLLIYAMDIYAYKSYDDK